MGGQVVGAVGWGNARLSIPDEVPDILHGPD